MRSLNFSWLKASILCIVLQRAYDIGPCRKRLLNFYSNLTLSDYTMQDISLEMVVLDTKQPPKASVIWLHGLGADGHDFVDLVPLLRLPEQAAIRFIFPHAPVRPVTLNAGMPMRAWFDIYGLTADAKQDERGIRETLRLIEQLIAQEKELGISADKIILAGFSQGGAMALAVGLRYPEKLAGIMGLSTLLPLAGHLSQEASPQNRHTSILLTHGERDPVIDISIGEMSKNYLLELGYPVIWRTYPMGHQVCEEEIRDISDWMQEVLA